MKRLIQGLDAAGIQIALKTCLALVIDLALALQLDWKPSFGAILVVVLQTPALGATYTKGALYIAGTLSGALAGLAMVALFAHERAAFLMVMALLSGFAVYRIQVSQTPYAWLICLVTFTLVGFFSVQEPHNAFDIAVMRSSTVCLAAIVVFLVHGILWPIKAGKAFEQQLHGVLDGCADLLSLMSCRLQGESHDSKAENKAVTKLVNAIDGLGKTLDAAVGDTARFKRFHAGYLDLINHLRELLLAILAAQTQLSKYQTVSHEQSPGAPDANLETSLISLRDRVNRLVDNLASPRDGSAVEDDFEPRVLATAGNIETPDNVLLTAQLQVLAAQIDKLQTLLRHLEDAARVPTSQLPPPLNESFSLTGVKFRKAAGGSLLMLLLGWFFIATQWPMGLQLAMVFASIALGLSAMLPMVMIGRQLLHSLILGGLLAAPLYLWIMPGINQYLQLVPWLCIVFVPILYKMATSPPPIMIRYLFTAIFVLALLSLDEEQQTYAFSSFVNMWFGLAGGFGCTIAVLALVSTIVPERAFSLQVHSFFANSAQFMQRIVHSAPGTSAGAGIINTSLLQWQGTLRQLQMWSSVVDYERVAGRDQQQVQALISSIEYLVLLLTSAVHIREQANETLDESVREQLTQVYDSCIHSLQLIADSLAQQQMIPDSPVLLDSNKLLYEIENRGIADNQAASPEREALASLLLATAQLRRWIEAIQDCQDKTNAIDWKAWNRNHL